VPVVSGEMRVFELHACSDLLSEGGVQVPVPRRGRFTREQSKDCGCRVAQLLMPSPPSPGYPAGVDRSQICSSEGATIARRKLYRRK